MEWSDRFATGFKRVDDAHRHIFRSVADFRDAVLDGRGSRVFAGFLDFLGKYVRAHFEHEEQCMATHNCPVAPQNVRAHARLIEELTRFQTEFATIGFTSQAALDLLAFIDAWLSDHICAIDIKLRDVRDR